MLDFKYDVLQFGLTPEITFLSRNCHHRSRNCSHRSRFHYDVVHTIFYVRFIIISYIQNQNAFITCNISGIAICVVVCVKAFYIETHLFRNYYYYKDVLFVFFNMLEYFSLIMKNISNEKSFQLQK